MKKIALLTALLLFFVGVIYSCRNDDSQPTPDSALKKDVDVTKSSNQSLLTTIPLRSLRGSSFERFLNSDTFTRHKDFISKRGEMNLDEIQYQEITIEGISYNFYVVSIIKNNSLVGKLEVLDLKDTKFLPNSDTYALNYADLSDYDMKSLTGSINLYDLNYDNFLHTRMKTEKGIYTLAEGNGLSQELLDKYSYLVNPKKSNNLARRHLCDSNGNGNISFGECYGCITRAIHQNATSWAICHEYQAMGMPWWGSCGASTAISCAIISSIS